jgi:superfamily II DNA or RNA helicase
LPFREELLGEVEESEYIGRENVLRTVEQQMQDRDNKLDVAQQAAFEHACSHRMALIVGPPGTTGKSFIGARVISSVARKRADAMKLLTRVISLAGY